MAQVEGLNLRGSRWYVRIVIPTDLQEAYGTARMNLALGTSERPQAVLKATLKRAEWLANFDAKRRELNPQPLLKVTPALSTELAQRVYMAILRDDDSFRSDLPLLAELANAREELKKKRTIWETCLWRHLVIPSAELPDFQVRNHARNRSSTTDPRRG